MENNKTLRSKHTSKFENIYRCSKQTNAKIKYQKFDFNPSYIYDYDEQNNNLIIYFSNLEEHFNLNEKISYDNNLNKLLKFKKLKKYLDKNNIKKEKKYLKNASLVRYIYKFEITNKILFSENNIFYDKILLNNNYISYILDIYLYPNNDYMNDGTNLIDEFVGYSPDWFYYTHLKKYTHSYGNYFIKNYKNKNKNILHKDINETLNYDLIDSIDLESIEKN